jgi:acyl-CoA thioesterase
VSDDFEAMAKAVNDDFQSMSGLEFLRNAITQGERSPMSQSFNQTVIAVEDGMAQVQAIPDAKFYNPMMRIHGGFIASLMDTALGSAVLTKLPKGNGAGTVALNVSFVRKVEVATGPLIATAHVLHAGRTMLTAEAVIKDVTGKIYAHGTGTFLVYPK